MTNLINNGTFDDLTGWELVPQSAGIAFIENGYAAISITEPSGAFFLTSGLNLNPSTDYDLTISLGSYPPQLSIQPYLLNYDNLSEIIAQADPVYPDVGTVYNIKFKTPSTVPTNACLALKLATIGHYYIDNVILEQSPSQNILKNSEFNGLSDWFFYTNGTGNYLNSAPSGETNVAWISLPIPGTNNQLYQSNIALKPNTTYILSYFYKSPTIGNEIDVVLIRHDPDYTPLVYNTKVSSVANGKTYEHTFTTGTAVPVNTRLMFKLHQSAGYIFDNITLKEVTVCTPLNIKLTL